MSDLQIEEIGRTRQYTEDIQIRSPATGFITLSKCLQGPPVRKGDGTVPDCGPQKGLDPGGRLRKRGIVLQAGKERQGDYPPNRRSLSRQR